MVSFDSPHRCIGSSGRRIIFINRNDVRAILESTDGQLVVMDSSGSKFEVDPSYGDYETLAPSFMAWMALR